MKTNKILRALALTAGLGLPMSAKAADSATPMTPSTVSATPAVMSATSYSPDNEVKIKSALAQITTGTNKGAFEVSLPEVRNAAFPSETYISVRGWANGQNLSDTVSQDQWVIDRLKVQPDGSLKSVNNGIVVNAGNTDGYLKAAHTTWNKMRKQINLAEVPIDGAYFMITSEDKLPLCSKILMEESAPIYKAIQGVLTPEQNKELEKAKDFGFYGWVYRIAKTDRTSINDLVGRAKQRGTEVRVSLTQDQAKKIIDLSKNYCNGDQEANASSTLMGDSISFTDRSASLGYESAQSTLTIPKYNRFRVKTGEKTLVDTVMNPELNASGRILLPFGTYVSGDGRAVYVFDAKELGAQASAKAGYKLGKVAFGAGAGALVQNAPTAHAVLYGPSGEVVYNPGSVELALLGSYFNGKATSNGNTGDASLVQGSLRLREALGKKVKLEQNISYTENTQFGNKTNHGDLDARVVVHPFDRNVLNHLGAYGSIGYGKQIGSDIPESDVRGRLGIEYR